jgi:hypothetical protein
LQNLVKDKTVSLKVYSSVVINWEDEMGRDDWGRGQCWELRIWKRVISLSRVNIDTVQETNSEELMWD